MIPALLAATQLAAAPPELSRGIVVDPVGVVFFADSLRQAVWRLDPGRPPYIMLPGRPARDLFLDAAGNLSGDELHAAKLGIWEMTRDGVVHQLLEPSAAPPAGFGLLLDAAGNRYAWDGAGENSRVLRRAPDGRVTVLAGGGTRGRLDGPRGRARLGNVRGMALAPDGAIVVSDGAAIRRIAPDGEVRTLADGFVLRDRSDDPRGGGLAEGYVLGVSVDAAGTIYAADYANRRVLRIRSDGTLTSVAYSVKPWAPTGVFARGDELYILEYGFKPPAEASGPRVRRLRPDGKIEVLAVAAP
ncbi:MAG TPA: hypothetical protein VJS92_09830 [Candidatus Polarisedimenticolaceae bacterium]|nr:hypothetical protein [Candidatus Polarisedimenticolaceae bacterium]